METNNITISKAMNFPAKYDFKLKNKLNNNKDISSLVTNKDITSDGDSVTAGTGSKDELFPEDLSVSAAKLFAKHSMSAKLVKDINEMDDKVMEQSLHEQKARNKMRRIKSDKNEVNGEQTNGEVDSKGSSKPRQPKCARCGYHDPEHPVAVKGHKRKCPYKDCPCDDCNLIIERQKLMAKTISRKRQLQEDLSDPQRKGKSMFRPMVSKKSRSDECLSETDRESGYAGSEDSRSKTVDNNIDKEFSNIWRELLRKITVEDIMRMMSIMYNTTEDFARALLYDYMKLQFKENKDKTIDKNLIIDNFVEKAKKLRPIIPMFANSPIMTTMRGMPLFRPFEDLPLSPPSSNSSPTYPSAYTGGHYPPGATISLFPSMAEFQLPQLSSQQN